MSFFRKIGKSVSSAFKKAPEAIGSVFKKAESVGSKITGGLDKVGDVLGKVADVGGQILSNPLTEAAATAIGGAFGMPEAGSLLGMAGKGLQQVKRASDLAKGASSVGKSAIGASRTARSGDLQGGISQARATIEKAKMLRDDAGVAGPMFV